MTPVRDEEAYISATLDCVARQSVRPAQWIIVNDGSKDRTEEILDRFALEHDWVTVVHRPDRGYRAAGSGVMEAVYAGLEQLAVPDWEFLVKLDGDLIFAEDYFARCFEQFASDPKLGLGGGVIYNRVNGALELERHPRFHVRGATKIYRRECWDSIGGLIRLPGWDTLDEVHANMNGWSTRSFESIHIEQQRFTGNAAGQWSNWRKNGRACFLVGYHPLFLVARALNHVRRPPYAKATLGIIAGYFGAQVSGKQPVASRPLRKYMRRQQLRRLLGMSSIWV